MARIFAFVLLGLVAMLTGNVKAASIRCEGCSDTQFREAAKQLGVGQHVITSFSTKQVRIFTVKDKTGGEPGVPPVLVAVENAVSADIQTSFNDVHAFYLQTAGTMKAAAVIHADEISVNGQSLSGTTAYDVMSNAVLKAALGDALSGSLPFMPTLERAGEQILQGAFAFFGAGDASIELTIVFSDGSSVTYRLSSSSSSAQYLPDRSRTKTGALIPEANAQQYQGTWEGADLPALTNYLQNSLGIPVTTTGTGNSYGGSTCVWDGRTLRCNLQRE